MRNTMLNGMMGLVVGDALGCPVQFLSRKEIKAHGLVTDMEEFGTYMMPKGTWTDDSSMALATLASMKEMDDVDPVDIMERFMDWHLNGAYTPYGQAFDQGLTCTSAILCYRHTKDMLTCGRTGEHANGNGALMRILPVCIYYAEMVLSADAEFSDEEAIESIHTVAALTHNHLRSHIACGLYYFMVKELMKADAQAAAENANDCNDLKKKGLNEILQKGLDAGFAFYEKFCKDDSWGLEQLDYYNRCRNLQDFAKTEEKDIKSSGYVLHTFEAVVWCLINTADFRECLLKAVNLGDDTDTVAAIAGGLAGIFYGYGGIPAEWLDVIVKREWIEELCQ